MKEYLVSADSLATAIQIDETRQLESLHASVTEGALMGAEVIAQAAPVDQGILTNSVRADETRTGAEIVADAPHAAIVELGSRPHTPPLAPLVEWAKRHGAENPWGMAVAIQRKIALEGTKPTHFVGGSMPKLERILGIVVEKGLRK